MWLASVLRMSCEEFSFVSSVIGIDAIGGSVRLVQLSELDAAALPATLKLHSRCLRHFWKVLLRQVVAVHLI